MVGKEKAATIPTKKEKNILIMLSLMRENIKFMLFIAPKRERRT
jgi:hypothetical protein